MKKITLLLLVVSLAFAGIIEGAEPKKLVVANSATISTTILASNPSGDPASLALAEQGCLPLPAKTVAPYSAIALKTAGMLCSEIALVDAPATLDAKSIVSFKYSGGRSSSVVGPFGAVTIERSSLVGPVINSGEQLAAITVFASEHTAITVAAYADSKRANIIAVEEFDIPKGVSQVVPKANFVGWLDITLGYARFGLTPSKAPLYGFVSNATPDNGNAIVYPFGE